MKSLKIFISLCAFLFCISCSSNVDNGNNTGDDNGKETEIKSIKGTKWKLEGIVDIKTDIIKEIEPKICVRCYTLTFNEDNSFSGFTSTNEFLGTYDSSTSSIKILGLTKVNELLDGEEFLNTLINMQTFSIQKNKLKLFNKEYSNYLIYKPIQ